MNNEIKHTSIFFTHFKNSKKEAHHQEIFDECKTLHDSYKWCNEINSKLEIKDKAIYIITNNNNLQKLENEIRTALPELTELAEGCMIHETSPIIDNNYIVTKKSNNVVWLKEINRFYEAPFEEDEIRKNCIIIGQPVTILHLLRWLPLRYKCDGEYKQNGSFWLYQPVNLKLDLSKPLLCDQSEDVINELCKLIK